LTEDAVPPAHRRRLAIAGVVALLVVGCGGPPTAEPSASSGTAALAPSAASSSPISASPSTRASTTVEDRHSDLADLVRQLKAIHPNPFLDQGEIAFQARVDSIDARAETLTDAGFLVAVMELMGHRDRDGHSGVWAMAQTGERLHAWPIWLWDFPDGLRVVAAREPDQDLVGARLVRVGTATVAQARQAVEPLVPRDNASSLRANLPMYLTLPEVLEELGLHERDGPGLSFEFADGSIHELKSDPLPIDAFRDWVFGVYRGAYPDGLPPDEQGPPYLRNRDLAFWTETLTEPAGWYVAYNAVARSSGSRTVGNLAAEILAASPTKPTQPFAIDLRNNGGGDNTTYRGLREAVEAMARERPGRVSIIAGRSTFSAAGNFVTDLLVGPEATSIRLVGEPPGGGLNMYGDVRVVTLPASGIVVLISSRYHQRAPDDDRLALTADVPVEVTWDDYTAGRDPVLEAAFGR
jgi:hypothetical protein